jgi:HlyD family secretion protein
MKGKWAVVLAAFAVAAAGCHRAETAAFQGRIEPEAVVAAATLGGRVKAVLVQRGQNVETGQVLVQFEAEDLDTRMKQVQTMLALAPPGVIETTASFVERVPPSTWVSLLRTDPVRIEAEREYAEALAAVERGGTGAARARLRRAERLRVTAFRRTGDFQPQSLVNLEKVRAEADRTMLWLASQRERLEVRSPVNGVVELLDLAVGDSVMPGAAVALVALPGKWEVTARCPYPAGKPVEVQLPDGTRLRAETADAGGDGHVRVLVSTSSAGIRAGDTVWLRF